MLKIENIIKSCKERIKTLLKSQNIINQIIYSDNMMLNNGTLNRAYV